VQPVHRTEAVQDWNAFAREWARTRGIGGPLALLVQGPLPERPDANYTIEMIALAPAR
jgi:hypothetical protein